VKTTVNLPGIPAQPTAADQSQGVAQLLPAAEPGYRLVPALVGTFTRHQVAYIECPTWCTEDHTAEPSALEDITHYADSDAVEIPSFTDPTTSAYMLYARLEADPVSSDPRVRDTHVLLWEDASAMEARLTPDMTESLADDLVAFAAQLRQLARAARQHNQVAHRVSLLKTGGAV
jgi:hypothetical protein